MTKGQLTMEVSLNRKVSFVVLLDGLFIFRVAEARECVEH
jgi:hypothetical protein